MDESYDTWEPTYVQVHSVVNETSRVESHVYVPVTWVLRVFPDRSKLAAQGEGDGWRVIDLPENREASSWEMIPWVRVSSMSKSLQNDVMTVIRNTENGRPAWPEV